MRIFILIIRFWVLHRGGLSVLVHALTGDDIADHTQYAYWLGDSVEINLEGLRPQ